VETAVLLRDLGYTELATLLRFIAAVKRTREEIQRFPHRPD